MSNTPNNEFWHGDYWYDYVYVCFSWIQCDKCGLEPDLEWAWEGTLEGEPGVEQFTNRVVPYLKAAGWAMRDDLPHCPRCAEQKM